MVPMRDVPELLDAIDLVIARADGVVPREILSEAKQYADEIRQRRGFLGETLVLGGRRGDGHRQVESGQRPRR